MPLETLQFVENLVVAELQPQDGTYAVMSTVTLPTLQPGWNALTYPLPDTRSVTTALQSINYSVIYHPDQGTELARVLTPPHDQINFIVPRYNLNIRKRSRDAGWSHRFPAQR